MTLRTQFTDQMKASMKAGDAARTSTLRMIMAKLKDTDIAARPKGIDQIPDEEIIAMLRGMVKSRRESVDLYTKGNRPELAASGGGGSLVDVAPGEIVQVKGVLYIKPSGSGMLVDVNNNFVPTQGDPLVPRSTSRFSPERR